MNYMKLTYHNGEQQEVEITILSMHRYLKKLKGKRAVKIEIFGDREPIPEELAAMKKGCHPLNTDYESFVYYNGENYSKIVMEFEDLKKELEKIPGISEVIKVIENGTVYMPFKFNILGEEFTLRVNAPRMGMTKQSIIYYTHDIKEYYETVSEFNRILKEEKLGEFYADLKQVNQFEKKMYMTIPKNEVIDRIIRDVKKERSFLSPVKHFVMNYNHIYFDDEWNK